MLKYIILALTAISVYSLTCNDGEFMSSSKCQYCPIHCKACSASNTCDVCESGFYLDKATNGCIR